MYTPPPLFSLPTSKEEQVRCLRQDQPREFLCLLKLCLAVVNPSSDGFQTVFWLASFIPSYFYLSNPTGSSNRTDLTTQKEQEAKKVRLCTRYGYINSVPTTKRIRSDIPATTLKYCRFLFRLP
ncbi:hypothetical protein ABW19_dt0205396 [Dactylella cylindrospora]|nr:hypothetical protein ABW19_dt0205396 [Dactylella cylindrospora]